MFLITGLYIVCRFIFKEYSWLAFSNFSGIFPSTGHVISFGISDISSRILYFPECSMSTGILVYFVPQRKQ